MFRRLKLFHRIVLHSVLLIIAVSGASVAVFHLAENPGGFRNTVHRAVSWLVQEIESTDGTRAAIVSKAAGFNEIAQTGTAVYRDDGTPVALIGADLPEPLTSQELARLRETQGPVRIRFGQTAASVRVGGTPAYLIVGWAHAGEMRIRFIVGLLVVLIVIGLMSVPLARSIARPVKHLTQTAARLKEGDLGARVSVESSDELAVLGSTLNDMASGISEHIRREKELLANVSHELRTPLSRIRVALEIAEEAGGDQAALAVQLAEIGEDVRELNQLVGDVLFSTRLDYSESGAADLPLNRAPIDLVPFVRDTVDAFERTHRIAVDRQIPEDGATVTASVDSGLLRRALENLLSNSLKYSGETVKIAVGLTIEPDAVSISVSDRGMGVSQENLPRLFEPFFRTDKSRARNAGGMGLGLTLSKRIVEAHGGRITASHRAQGGLTVKISLPI